MFTQPLDHIITQARLKQAFEEISQNSSGLDDVSYSEFKKDIYDNIDELCTQIISGTYSPEPLKIIEIDKPNSDEKRPISLDSIKDKIIQRVLLTAINPYFDDIFSDKSYAYRSGKSTINAINRTQNFIDQKYHYILKTDIDNFFESINHDKLLQILDKHIADKRIIKLIGLFVQTGGFKKIDFFDHSLGVHQGDILSPLLSNIYLDLMDDFLDKKEIPFVRYADDFIVFSTSKEQIESIKQIIIKLLSAIDLNLEESKTYIAHINDGFTFLGVHFQGRIKTIDNDRLQKSISKMHKIAQQKESLIKFTKNMSAHMHAIKNYYLKIIRKDSAQFVSLQEHIIDSCAQKVFYCKTNGKVNTKKSFKEHLESLPLDMFFDLKEINDKINLIIAKGYERYLANKSPLQTAKTLTDKKKNKYSKEFARQSTLHINQKGLMLSISKNKFVVKEFGKVKNSYPSDTITRIILEGKGFALSTDVIKACADKNITIDLIDSSANHYASITSYKASTTQIIHKQAMILTTPMQLKIATEFIRGKAKNQINYLKYLDKYHTLLDANIAKMEAILTQIKKAPDISALMGYEGSIASLYWDSIKLILDVPFSGRITQGAKDIVNSSLNYGYAILYGKVQHAIVQAGLSLHISFLHAIDNRKPTLVYDMIEEFRTFIVDRTIISILNKNEPITIDKEGMLTKKSRQLIAKNIYEKLGSYTMWKKQSIKIENIIQTQCYNLANLINQKDDKYKAFIGKY